MTYHQLTESGRLKAGDQVIVYVSGYRTKEEIPATVVKANPVWIVIAETDVFRPREWRMHRDSQRETAPGVSHTSYATHFRTLEQHEWHQAQKAAQDTLRSHGVRVCDGSRWDSPEGLLALAALLEADRPSLPAREPGAALAAVKERHPVLLDHYANHAF